MPTLKELNPITQQIIEHSKTNSFIDDEVENLINQNLEIIVADLLQYGSVEHLYSEELIAVVISAILDDLESNPESNIPALFREKSNDEKKASIIALVSNMKEVDKTHWEVVSHGAQIEIYRDNRLSLWMKYIEASRLVRTLLQNGENQNLQTLISFLQSVDEIFLNSYLCNQLINQDQITLASELFYDPNIRFNVHEKDKLEKLLGKRKQN